MLMMSAQTSLSLCGASPRHLSVPGMSVSETAEMSCAWEELLYSLPLPILRPCATSTILMQQKDARTLHNEDMH